MKNKIWIIVIAVLLVLIVAILVITNNDDVKDNTPDASSEINMEVKRDESIDIEQIKENFNTNVQNIKDGVNKTENE